MVFNKTRPGGSSQSPCGHVNACIDRYGEVMHPHKHCFSLNYMLFPPNVFIFILYLHIIRAAH